VIRAMITEKLSQTSKEMTPEEAMVKLAIVVLFVPVPLLIFTLGGIWLDYYKFDTLPLFSVLGVVLGISFASLGVYKIVTHSHRKDGK